VPRFDALLNRRTDGNDRADRMLMVVLGALTRDLGHLAAEAMRAVALREGVELEADAADWPVFGHRIDPSFSINVPPLTIIKTMNPVYRGFDFGPLRPPLYTELRQGIWNKLLDVNDGGLAFALHIQWGDTMGGNVDSQGWVQGEYGGSTGIRQLMV
jgi:hypothetical protein